MWRDQKQIYDWGGQLLKFIREGFFGNKHLSFDLSNMKHSKENIPEQLVRRLQDRNVLAKLAEQNESNVAETQQKMEESCNEFSEGAEHKGCVFYSRCYGQSLKGFKQESGSDFHLKE